VIPHPVSTHGVPAVALLEPSHHPLSDQENAGTLHRIEVLRHLLHLIPGGLGRADSKIQKRIGKLGDTVLVGSNSRTKLGSKSFPDCGLLGSKLAAAGTERLAAGAELGRLIVGQTQLLLHSGGEPITHALVQGIGPLLWGRVRALGQRDMEWSDNQ
jgi:hypothetical protein